MEKAVIIRTKKQSCAHVKAWAYKKADAAYLDEELNDGDSDYREFASVEYAKTYWKEIADRDVKNSNDAWNFKTATAALEALEEIDENN